MSELRLKFQNIWAHTGFQRYLKNTGWMFFGKIASLIISFIATAYIARNLGPKNYGELSYAISFVGLFGFLASFGIDQILQRDIIRFPDKKDGYLGTAIALRIVTSILTTILCIVTAYSLSPKDVSIILIIIISLTFVASSFNLLNYEFLAHATSKHPSLLSLVVVVILNLLKILVIFMDKGVIYLALVILIEPVLYSLGFIYLRIKYYGKMSLLYFDTKIAKQIMVDSYPLIFASAFYVVYSRIDQVMLKNMIDSQSVGLYDAAVRVSEVWYFIPNIIISSLFPAIINAQKSSSSSYFSRIKKLLVLITGISVIVTLVTCLFSRYIIEIIYGAKFISSSIILNIYIWSSISTSINIVLQQVLIAENKSALISKVIFFGMIVNIALNFILIPKFGAPGAAFATLISYCIPIISLYFFKDSRKVLKAIYLSK